MLSSCVVIWDCKKPLEIVKESHEKEIGVDHSSDVNWKLVEQSFI